MDSKKLTVKQKVKISKIVLDIIWIFLLIFPFIRVQFEKVTITDSEIVYNLEKQGDDMILTCDKDVVSGTVTLKFYNNDTEVKTIIKEFDENEGKSFTVTIYDSDWPATATRYEYYECRVTTDTQETVSVICFLLAFVLVIVMVFVWRIKVYETEIAGKSVVVYKGYKKKYLSVNGNLAEEVNVVYIKKPITLKAELADITIFAEIGNRGKVRIYSQVKEKEQVENPEKKEKVFETTGLDNEEKMAKELFAGAGVSEKETDNNAKKTEKKAKSKTEKPAEKTETAGTEEKPKRGRPRKIKTETIAGSENEEK